MKFAQKSLVLIAACAAAILAGCAKKPVRPDPSSTALGQTPGGGGGTVTPEVVPTTTDTNTQLTARDASFDMNGQNRTALQPVYFAFDRSAITKPDERAKLQAAKDYLDKNPGTHLLLEGHCDWRGTAEYNLALGDRRANEAKKYLLSIGVTADKIETISKGSEEAKKDAKGDEAAKDRRDDLVVLKAAGT